MRSLALDDPQGAALSLRAARAIIDSAHANAEAMIDEKGAKP
jgi:hypothetical protein